MPDVIPAELRPLRALRNGGVAGDLPSYRIAARRVIAALWLVAIVYVVALSVLVARGAATRATVGGPLAEQVILLLLWGAATPAILWSAERLPLDRARWLSHGLIHLGLASAFIVALNVVAPTIAWLVFGRGESYGAVLRWSFAELVRAYHLALIVYAFILGAGHYLHTLDVRRREQLRAERLRADLASAQLRALTLRLQPHFLFNTLNALGALIITERNREAFEVVGRLGELLRALLAIDAREEVTLREELELTDAYAGIEQARLGERLRVTWKIVADVAHALVPPMTLQPLVENAVRHGVARRPHGGCLTILAGRAGSRLVLEVRDDGPGLGAGTDARATVGGLGLENTRQRLAHLYGDDQRVVLTRDGGWTIARIELPFHTAPNDEPAMGLAGSEAAA